MYRYKRANAEKVRDTQRRSFRKRYAADPEKHRVRRRKWYANNVAICTADVTKRRALKTKATPKWLSKEQTKQIQAFYIEARRLSKLTGIQFHVDHIIPIHNGIVCGLHVPWNLQILTYYENTSKNNRFNVNEYVGSGR